MKPYVPQPGTIPHKVVEHLKTQPPGTELSTSELAELIGQPRNSMAACLNSPRNHGALKSRKLDTGVFVWSLGDGTPPPKPDDYVPDEPLHRKAPDVQPKPASPFELRKPRGMNPRETPAGPPSPAPAPRPAPMPKQDRDRAKFGVYSDNTFCIQRGTDAIWLTPEEFKDLAEFIAEKY